MGNCCDSQPALKKKRTMQTNKFRTPEKAPLQIYNYEDEPLWDIFHAQEPEHGTLRRKQVTKALIQAGIDVEDVVSAFDEIDKNRDDLVTYEELRYYVRTFLGEENCERLINVQNFDVDLSSSSAQKLQQWRALWDQIQQVEDGKVTKEDAIECIHQNCQMGLSPAIKRALEHQIDVNQDNMCDYYEFARACEKVLGQ